MFNESFQKISLPGRNVGEELSAVTDDREALSSPERKSGTGECGMGSKAIDQKESERDVFHKARWLLPHNSFYRWIIYLYAERKLVVFFLVHFVCTMTIWAHFALVKFEKQASTVPEGANRYWWKRIAPPLEFGSMHAILFQLALIPLTMSRFSIASLSETFVDKIIPLNRALRMHIHLGYTMIIIVFFATIFFFTFFGILCRDGEEAFCMQFTSEIMITGYAILASLLVIGGTSYFRHQIPYEVFYAIHHLVFVMYFITIAHTLDMQERKGIQERSQTFKWFSATLMYYMCDRAAMHLNHKYWTKIVDSKASLGSNDSRMLILKISRPVLFHFKPGQYAFLRISKIDNHFHPFSIASGPESSVLEFYIEVSGETSWTDKLWDLLDLGFAKSGLDVEVMGPYGTSLAKTDDYTHVLALGAGTGIVPVLSLFKQHVSQMLQLHPAAYLKELKKREQKSHQMDLVADRYKGSMAKKIITACFENESHEEMAFTDEEHSESSGVRTSTTETRRQAYQTRSDQKSTSLKDSIRFHETIDDYQTGQNSMIEMRKAAFLVTRSIYGVVWLTLLPVFGVALIGLTLSWNTMPIDLYPHMIELLQALTVFFQLLFATVALIVWDCGNGITPYIDMAVCLVAPFADWYWFKVYDYHGVLHAGDLVVVTLFTTYMTARVWMRAVMPRHNSWQCSGGGERNSSQLDRLEMIWTTRSADQVAHVLPSILEYWDMLVAAWGVEQALQVCRISIHITDPDLEACTALLLRDEFRESDLMHRGAIHLERVNLSKIIEEHTLDMICTRRKSYSLLAFCGSPDLAQEIHQTKLSNDMVTAITGNKKHQMEFVSESYGGTKAAKKKKTKKLTTMTTKITTRSQKTKQKQTKQSANKGPYCQKKEESLVPTEQVNSSALSKVSRFSLNPVAPASSDGYDYEDDDGCEYAPSLVVDEA